MSTIYATMSGAAYVVNHDTARFVRLPAAESPQFDGIDYESIPFVTVALTNDGRLHISAGENSVLSSPVVDIIQA